MSSPKKIGVIGASIAGPALCFWLKKYGFEPTLIERSKSLRKGGYAIDLRGIAVDVAKIMGVHDLIVQSRTSITKATHVNASGKIIHEECGETFGHRDGDDIEIVRSRLVEILMDQINDVPCRFNCFAQEIIQHEDQVEVIFNDGSTECFDLVIGADGLHSSTRKLSFKDDEYTTNNLGIYLGVFSTNNHWGLEHASLFCENEHKSIYIESDHNPDEALVGLMFKTSENLTLIKTQEEAIGCLNHVFRDFKWQTDTIFSCLNHDSDLYFDSASQVKMPSWSKNRVALVGDAGYCASPMSGQGTSLALVGAYILAGELKRSANNHEEAFKQYHNKMRPYVEKNQAIGAWVSEFYLAQDEQDPEKIEKRNQDIMIQLREAGTIITLPVY
jgi:2-polyprenyl-6-methoxyphenol hydroxylase-like FAD-dependent oxidoreductase